MKIVKRNGEIENLSIDKILYRLKKIKNDSSLGKLSIDTDIIALKVVSSIYDGVSSSELDEEAARISISMTENFEYGKLASRIIISNLHKNTTECFSDIMENLYGNMDINDTHSPVLSDIYIKFVRDNKDILNELADYKRDYLFDYFGFKTLEKSYLMRLKGKVIERPQHLYLRVSIQVHLDDINSVIKTYNLISQHFFTFASPTIFNAGSRLGNLSSCFLIGTVDSIEGIFKTMSDVAQISKVGGGIGIHINNIRSKGTVIRGTNGHSDGIIPMLRVYNDVSLYVNQCITPDTIVYSKDGFKRMDEITCNDYLVTNDGCYKKVNEVIINKKDEEIYEIRNLACIDSLKCTKEHDIYITKSLDVFKPEFIPASELREDYFMGYPIPTFEKDDENMTKDDCRIYGMIASSADIIGNIYRMKFNNENKIYIINFLTNNKLKYWISDLHICWIYNSNKMDKNKCFEYLHLPKDKITQILKGMIDSCGYEIDKKMYFKSIDKNLIYSCKFLLLRLGFLSGHCTKIGLVYELEIYLDKHLYFERDNILWTKIESISKIKYKGDVYDFNMIDNHNYLTDSGLVHNSGKRKGSFAIYLSPEHPDIFEFLDLRKNQGSENMRARDLFYAMWMPDLFMKQVESDSDWYLLDPDECPRLNDTYGDEYEELYWKYVSEKKYRKKVKAQDIWVKILESQIETGNPYILYKDQINKKSNQKNIGVIKSSNLCVAPETKILTSKGYYEIQDLNNQEIEVWNGKEFSKTIVRKTGENQELLKVKLNNGTEIECTPYHKFYIESDLVIKQIDAKDLTKDMKLINTNYPIIKDGEENLIFDKNIIPINYSLKNKLKWIEYFYDSSNSYDKKSLINIRYLFQTLGYNPEIIGSKLVLTENKRVLVEEVIITNRISDTYCFTEEKRGMGIFNGVLLGNCAEITLYSDEKQYAVCFTGDTNILTKEGYRRIDECDNKEIYSYFENDNEMIVKHQYIKSKLIDNGIKDIYELNCVGMNPIKVTENHLFVVIDRLDTNLYKWKKVKDLNENDNIIIPKTNILPGYNISISNKSINHEYLGMGYNAIFIPKGLNKSTPINIASFLSGLYSSNGSISNPLSINLSGSIELLYATGNLLKCFGIESKVYKSGLIIEYMDSILNFYKYIMFCKNKQKLLSDGIKIPDENNFNKEYCKFKSLDYIGRERVYDLNVPDAHNFIAEGFVVHNCNLLSIALPMYVKYNEKNIPYFDHDLLYEVAKYVILPMNNVIDFNYYPVLETSVSNFNNRPIGIGTQGLSDVFIKMRLPFESCEAKKLNKEIWETLYFATLTGSMELSKKNGPYSTFKGSPISEGKFQFDLCAEFNGIDLTEYLSDRWDWETLRKNVIEFGVRNSTLMCQMPTASSAQIMGNTESVEAFDSCIFKRRVLSGEYVVCNKHLVKDLTELGLWNKLLKDTIIAHNGSIQDIDGIPDNIKELYKTVWEMSMKNIIDQSAERSVFIDQTTSLNLFMASPTIKKLTSMHFYAWRKHLKTGIYYLRSKNSSSAAKFSIDPELEKRIKDKQEKGKKLTKKEEVLACSIENKEECEMCSS